MRRLVLIACGLIAALPALAAEPSGCDKFKWPIDRERAILTAEPLKIESGATAAVAGKSIQIALHPLADAKLPSPPERAPKDPATFAGYVQLDAVPTAGAYLISFSAAVWVDAIQGGKNLKPIGFSGATDCEGIRKVLEFDLGAGPLTLQVSGVASNSIILAITPAP
jgi:hypothetical protein